MPDCSLSNPAKRVSSELVYNFLVQAPFVVLHYEAYKAGNHKIFEGHDCYLIGCCGMTAVAFVEPISQPSAKMFASAIMKILLRYGICATEVLNKDSKFLVSAVRRRTFFKSTATSYLVPITTECW